VLCVGVEGTAREVEWQVETLQQECSRFEPIELTPVSAGDARQLWLALTEFQTSTDEPLTFKANLLPSRTMEFLQLAADRELCVQAHAGNGIVIGHLPDDVATVAQANEILAPLRQFCNSDRGNLVIFHCAAEWKPHLSIFGTPEPSWCLMRTLKSQLDPHRLLNTGRFIDNPATETSRA
jgi:glycolate oxidase FAD binding subunit